MAAPSWEPDGEGEGGGLMLRVEGVEREGEGEVGGGDGIDGEGGLEGLKERWERGMEGLRRVVERGLVLD